MEKIFEIASNVGTPLALAGLTAAVLFFTYRAIIKLKIFSKQKEQNAFKIINKILNYLFVLSLVSIVLGVGSYLISNVVFDSKKNSKDPPIEELQPKFDSSFLEKEGNLYLKAEKKLILASIQNNIIDTSKKDSGELNIVHVRDTVIEDLPIKYFTLLNRTQNSVVITGAAVDIREYTAYMSIPETRQLKPLVIWDITLPYSDGYFEYDVINPIIIGKDDAVVIGVRFSCRYKGKKISPSSSTKYLLDFIFLTENKEVTAISHWIKF